MADTPRKCSSCLHPIHRDEPVSHMGTMVKHRFRSACIAALRAQLEQAQAERDALKVANDTARSAINIWMQTDAQLRDTIARQRAWIESAGHRPGCVTLIGKDCGCGDCDYCRLFENGVEGGDVCDCGYAEQVRG